MFRASVESLIGTTSIRSQQVNVQRWSGCHVARGFRPILDPEELVGNCTCLVHVTGSGSGSGVPDLGRGDVLTELGGQVNQANEGSASAWRYQTPPRIDTLLDVLGVLIVLPCVGTTVVESRNICQQATSHELMCGNRGPR